MACLSDYRRVGMFSLDGRKMMWVWHPEASGGVEAIVQRALRFGVTALAFKHDDGGHPFSDSQSTFGLFPAEIERYRDVCRWCGIKFGLWGYHYGRDWKAETTMVFRANILGADFYIVDWEAEFERAMMTESVLQAYLLACIAACGPQPSRPVEMALYHAPLAQPSFHTPWQYQMFQYAFDGMMPQIYHGAMELPLDMALDMSYRDYANYNLMRKPIYPIGQAYDIPAGDITAWGTRATSIYGAKGLGWWDMETATDDMMRAINRVPLEEENMRRVNGTHPDFQDRTKWEVGTHGINCRSGFGLLATDRRVVLDLHLTPVIPIKAAPVVTARDGGDCAYADQFDEVSGYRKNVTAYMHSNPDGAVLFDVQGGAVWVELVGILEAG